MKHNDISNSPIFATAEKNTDMFETGPRWLPKELHHKDTLMDRAHEYAREAYRIEGTASLSKSDSIASEKKLQAKEMYARALELQEQYKSSRTSFEKAKPTVMNSVILLVVAAELVSIPMLGINIYQMTKKHQLQPSPV